MRSVVLVLTMSALVGSARPGFAQSAPPSPGAPGQAVEQVRDELERLRKEFEAVRRQYDDRLLALEQQLARLDKGPSTVTTGTTGTTRTLDQDPQTPPPAAPATGQAAPAGSAKIFNPDMSVNGNFVGAAGKNDLSTQPAMQMSEVEASFQAVVDPYARADFFLSATPDGLDVEEGYITFTSLPANLLLKVGKMRAQFGKVNTMHTHAMPTVDRPLVTNNLVGGEDGLSDAGMSVSHLVNNPHLFLELTGEVYGGSSEVFQSPSRSKLTYVGRVRGYRDLTEATNIDIGTSYAFGPTDLTSSLATTTTDTLNKQLFGVDATFRYRPLRRAIYTRFNLRTELIWSKQDTATSAQENAFGYYALGEYQFARRWYLGGRFDRSGRVLDANLTDTGGSFFVTFWPTEFSQIRGQYRYTKYAENINANEFLFQFNFSIGAHGAHVF